jgi:hypothetical protein
VAPRGSRPLRHIATLPLCSTAHYCPHSLSALQLIIVPIPSLLYSSLLSPFPLCSAAHYCPHSLSALQHIIVPIPSLLYSALLPHSLCSTAHSYQYSLFLVHAIPLILAQIPSLLFSSFLSLFLLSSVAHFHPYSLAAPECILNPTPSLHYSSFLSLFPLCSTAHSCPTQSLLYTSFSSLFPLCSTAHSCVYSLSAPHRIFILFLMDYVFMILKVAPVGGISQSKKPRDRPPIQELSIITNVQPFYFAGLRSHRV